MNSERSDDGHKTTAMDKVKKKKWDCISVFACFEKFLKATSIYFSYNFKQLIFVTNLEFFSVR